MLLSIGVVFSWRTWRTSPKPSRHLAWSLMTSSKPTTCLRMATWHRSRRRYSRSLAWWVLEIMHQQREWLFVFKRVVINQPYHSVRPRPRAARHGWTSEWSTQTSRRGCLMRRSWRLDSVLLAYRYSSSFEPEVDTDRTFDLMSEHNLAL